MKQATLLSCKRTTAKDTVEDFGAANTTSRAEEDFGIQMSETSGEKRVSIIDAFIIDADKECEAEWIEEVASKDDIESEVTIDESMEDGHMETLSPLIPETPAVAFEETEETEGGEEKTKFETNACDKEIAEKMAMCETTKDGNIEDSCQLILETSAVADQRETGETVGGGEESEAGKDEVTETGTQTDERGQDGKPESEGTTATKEEETDTEVGMMVRSTAREHGEQGRSEKRIMRLPKDRRMSAHPEVDIDVWVGPNRRTYAENNEKKCRRMNRSSPVKTKKRK